MLDSAAMGVKKIWVTVLALLLLVAAGGIGLRFLRDAGPASTTPRVFTPTAALDAGTPAVSDAQLATLSARVDRLRPRSSEERWRAVPWRTDLMQALRESQAQGKPIFFWLIDGHPLGLV